MTTIKPGELVVSTLLRQFVSLSKLKIERALEEDNENNLMKSMHLSDDAAFEQLLESFYMSAEFALPSLLKALIQWYQSQHSSGTNYEAHRGRNFSATEKENEMIASCHDGIGTKDNQRLGGNVPSTSYTPSKSDKTSQSVTENTCTSKSMYMVSSEMRVFAERRDLAIDIVFCQVLLSLLRQLSYHPGHNHLIEMILDQSFRRFKYREDLQPQNSENVNLVADLYAEIVGVLSQSRFALVRSRFTRHLNELRAKENNPNVKPSIVSLIMGMKFFRVKMHPIEDFVNCFTFLQELGQYFLEVKEPEIKHVLSDLFVEILLPVAAVARQEVNIPALKNFVENLYPTSLELASKKKHIPALFPLVTCLLCVGTKSFFLNNWANFMTICLSHLKNRTPKVALVSLQSLSCLLWVYIVRIRGEKHSETQSKLHHIVNSLFPKNQKFVVPKDAPINIFVRIIQFIAHEKLEFAVKEIIIDRLGVNGLQKTLFMPERMNIGLCAFLLIAYGLQQKAGAPPMPQQCIGGATSGVTGGGATGGCGGIRQTVIKRSFLGTNLNDALGHNLGIQNYLAPVRRAFESILRQLDTQVCRVMILPKQEVSQKEVEELMTTERKPKLDLLKTCVACIPRLLPNDMGQPELLELLAKVCLHVDEDLRKMAQQAMANLIVELPAFRVKTIQVFIQFIQKNVSDTSPQKLDGCLKTLFHLLNNWKLALQKDGAVSPSFSDKSALYEAEGFALVMLCHCRSITRRLAVHILRKCRALIRLINAATAAGDTPVSALAVDSGGGEELCCIDVLDRLVPQLLERVLPLIPVHERSALSSNSSVHVDFSVLTERCSPVWLGGSTPMTSYPAVVMPTNFVSNQYSSLMPMNDLDRGQVKDVSEQVTRRAQFSMYPADTRVDAGEPSNNNNVSSNNNNIKDSIGDVHKSMTSSLYDRTMSPMQRDNRRVDHQSVAHAAATFPHSGTPGLFRRACQNQPHHPHHPVQHAQQAYIVQPVPERVILNDVWATCLFIAFSPENLVTACPMAIKYAWSVLYHRLSQLFPIIDPSAQIVENRASSILRSSSKKPTMEREQFFPLWHNYAVLGCCIAPNSTGSRLSASRIAHYQTGSPTEIGAGATSAGTRLGMRYSTPSYVLNPDPSEPCGGPPRSSLASSSTASASASSINSETKCSSSAPGNTATSTLPNSSSPTGVKETARDLVRLLVPLLRCEQTEIRDSAIGGLGRINPLAFRDVLDELLPLLKESVDRKQENVRRRRRRDGLRASLIRVLALMSQNGVFAYPESNCLTGQGCLISQLSDYLDGMRIYFESVADQAINPTCPTFFGSGMGTNVSGSSNMTVVSPQSGSTGPGTNSVLGPGNVTIGGGGGGSSGIVAATGMAAASGVGMGSSASAIAASTAAVLVTAATNPVLTEAHLLVEMRLHLCVFLFEMIRQLPKDKRTQLLPTAMRHQMFLLISRWSGYHDHVMGLCPESDTSHLRVTMGQTSSVGVGSSQSSETYGPTGHNLDPGSDSLVQVGASPTSSAISSSANVITEPTSSAVASNTGSASVCGMVSATDQAPTSMHSVPIQDSWELRLWTDLMWLANQAMAALACCGPIYDPHALFADHVTDQSTSSSSGCEFSSSGTNPNPGYILRWVSGLLTSRDAVLSSSPWLWHCPVVDAGLCHVNLSHIGTAGYGFFNGASILTGGTGRERRLDSLLRQLGEETLTLLLDLNQASHLLLNWTIDQCYTSANVALANACFFVICRVLGNISDFPCDFIPLLTLAMVYLDHPQKSLSDRAAHLLRVIYYRFVIKPGLLVHDHVHLNEDASNPCTWDDDPSISPQSERDTFSALCAETKISLQLWQSILRWSPTEVVRQFAAQHPDFTLPIISEITRRMGTDRNVLSVPLLRLLLPWIINVELIDLIGDPEDGTNGNNKTVRYPGLFGFGTRDDSDGEPNACHQRRSIRQRQIIHCTDRSGGRTLGHCRLSDDDVDRDAGLADHEGDDDEEEDEERCLIADSHAASDLDHSEEETEDDDTAFLPNYFAPKTTGYHSMERHPSWGATRHRCTCPRVEDAPVDSDGLDSDTNNEMDFSAGPLGSSCRRPKAGTVPLIGPHGEADLKHGVRPRWMTDSVRKPHEDSLRATCEADFWSTVPPTLRTNGWGSKQATEFVLNNLFYLTLHLAECPSATDCLKQVWITLTRHRPSNLRVILRYLIVVTSVAPATLLSHAKRLVTYVAYEQPESVLEELVVELQTIDGIGLTVERTTKLPFFRVTTSASRARDVIEPSTEMTTMTTLVKSPLAADDNHSPNADHLPETDRSPKSIQAVLKAVQRESAHAIDPELVAIDLAAAENARALKPERKFGRNRASALPFFHSKRHVIEEVGDGLSRLTKRRPKSATSHPSPSSESTACPPTNLIDPVVTMPPCATISTVVTEHQLNVDQSEDRMSGGSVPNQTTCVQQVVPDADDGVELDVDSPYAIADGARRDLRNLSEFTPEDKYATLRAKDFARLLFTSGESKDQASSIGGGSETELLPDEPDPRQIIRRGTLPSTEDSRERYYQGGAARCNVCRIVEKSDTCASDPLGRGSTRPRLPRRCKIKTRSQPRGHARTPLHTVSLPPNIASLAPLPLPLPSGVPSLPSLWLTSMCDRPSTSSGSSQRSTARQIIGKTQSGPGATTSMDAIPIGKARSQPLSMPADGGYQAPLGKWLTEPLVIGGSVVFTGSWPLAGARSPLVLLLAGGLTQCTSVHLDWDAHLPFLLLCVLLGMDHCRALVQEECKQLLVSLLNLACPEQDALRILRFELEAMFLATAYPSSSSTSSRRPNYRLTVDGGPYRERFDLFAKLPPTFTMWGIASQQPPPPVQPTPLISQHKLLSDNFSSQLVPPKKPERRFFSPTVATRELPGTHLFGREASPPPCGVACTSQTTAVQSPQYGTQWTGSTFSLISTATLIPGREECTQTEIRHPLIDLDERSNESSKNLSGRHNSPDASVGNLTKSYAQRTKPIRAARSSRTVYKDIADPVTHSAMERKPSVDPKPLLDAIGELRKMLLFSSGQALWTWEDFNLQRFQYTTAQNLTRSSCDPAVPTNNSDNLSARNNQGFLEVDQVGSTVPRVSVEDLVLIVARVLALSYSDCLEDAENCLRCHHGPPHRHSVSHNRLGTTHRSASAPTNNHCMVARLSQCALTMGLSCPNRHYASRSLQIFRVLGAHLDPKSLSKLVARLGETIADANEELQGYVAELFLTAEAAIRHLQTKSDCLPELATIQTQNGHPRTAPTSPHCIGRRLNVDSSHAALVMVSDRRRQQQRHSTSTGLTTNSNSCTRPSGDLSPRLPPQIVDDAGSANESGDSIRPTKSTHMEPCSTKPNNVCRLTVDEQMDLVCGIFWTAVFLLESNFEHEYLAGVRLLSHLVPSVIGTMPATTNTASQTRAAQSSPSLCTRAQKMLNQMHFSPPFPGLLSLTIKGCSSTQLVDPACRLLVSLIPFLNSPLVVPSGRHSQQLAQMSFPIALLTLMPLLLTAWDEDPTTLSATFPEPTCTDLQQQSSVLQGGFLGRDVCCPTNATTVPRALGSWTMMATMPRSASASASITTGPSQAQALRLGRADSIGTGMLNALGAVGSGWNLNNCGANNFPRTMLPTPLRPKNPICIQAADALAQTALQLDSIRLNNLALILRLYANGAFSKDVDQWARCVVCYLLEGYSQYTSHLLHHLTTLITTGPPCLQMPLLKVAHLLLEQVDLANVDLGYTLQNFITTVTGQFLGTVCWPEITRILQVIVSRSAVLTTVSPPSAYTLAGLDPSGSGRVLDLTAAAAAVAVPLPESEPPRLELAGPVVDCQFNMLSEAPLLAPRFALTNAGGNNGVSSVGNNLCDLEQSGTAVDSLTTGPFVRRSEPMKMVDSDLAELFATAASSWNKTGACQAHVRERLYRLIGCYGLPAEHRISVPRSPSVIFSQSTETLDPQLSVHSSSETTSMVDVSNSDDIHLDETSSMEQAAVFRDLDTYLDAQLMNINFLGVPDCRLASTSDDEPRRPWGVRGQSITCHTDFTEDSIIEQVTDLLPTMRIPLEQSTIRANVSPPRSMRKRNIHTHLRAVATNGSIETGCENAVDWTEPALSCTDPKQELAESVHSRSLLVGQPTLQFTPIHHRHTGPGQLDIEAEDDDEEEEGFKQTEVCPRATHTSCDTSLEAADGFDGVAANCRPSLMTVSLHDSVPPAHKTRRGRTSSGTNLLLAHTRLSPPDANTIIESSSKTPIKRPISHSPTCSQCSMASDPMELISQSFTSVQSPSTCTGGQFSGPSAPHVSSNQSDPPPFPDTEAVRPLSPSSPDSAGKYGRIVKRPDTLIPFQTSMNILSTSQQRPALVRARGPIYARSGKLPARFASPSSASSRVEMNSQLAPHRSLSTSNLTLLSSRRKIEVIGSPESMKANAISVRLLCTGSGPVPTGRLQSPVLKFHKNFTSKRQSLSAEDLPWLIRQPKVSFLIPTSGPEISDTDAFVNQNDSVSIPKSPTLPSSQSTARKDCGSFLHFSPTDSLSENKPPCSPPSLTRLGLARSSHSLPESADSRNQLATTTQRGPASITPVVYHKLMTRTSLFSSVTYPWTEMVAVERMWLNKLKKVTSDEAIDQVTPVLSGLPTVFTALAIRCQNGVRAALNASGFSWDEASETARLTSVSELLTTTVRPPYLFYPTKSAELTEREKSTIQSSMVALLESYEETVSAINHLAKLAFDRDSTLVQRGCINVLFKLVSFLQTTHTTAEQLYRACPPERIARELSERLQNALDRLAPSMAHYNNGRSSNSDNFDGETRLPSAPYRTEFISRFVDQMDTLLRELPELTEVGDPEPLPKQLAVRFFGVIDLYNSRHTSDSGRLLTIDCVLGIFSLYVSEYFAHATNSEPDPTVVYLLLPSIGLGRTGSPSLLEQCSYLKHQLDTLS